MPPLSSLALRYIAWFVGLSVLFGLLVGFAGVPATLATGVILAALPAADVGLHATRKATRALEVRDWAVIWGMCMAIYLLFSVVGPALLSLVMGQGRMGGTVLRSTAMVALATGVMQAIFLWIGNRAAGGQGAR
jgi:hypothetical protein